MDTALDDSSLAQATYVQQKLETFYNRVYGKLYRYKDALLALQEVLVWRRAFTTVLLYIVIHGTFVYVVQNSHMTALSFIGNGMLWCLVIDAVLRAALRDKRGLTARSEPRPKPVAFDKVLFEMNTPKSQRLESFETICLRVAQVLMWLDNLRLAFCYWLLNEPLTCAALLALPGFVLSVVGKLVPTIVIVYIAVMSVVVYPYVEFYEQQKKLTDLLNTYCPRLMEQLRTLPGVVQNLKSPCNDDNPELSLDVGGERETQETLNAEFQQAMVRERKPQEAVTQVTPAVINAPDESFGGTPFGSISNLDSSLNLPSFTPQMLEQHRRNRLDPFTDSLELSADFTDSGRHHHTLARVDEAAEDELPRYTEQPEGLYAQPPPPYSAHTDMLTNVPKGSSTPQPASAAPYKRHITRK